MTDPIEFASQTTEPNELRTCKGCIVEKPITKYYKTCTSKKTGNQLYRRKCKECIDDNTKKWLSTHPDLHNEHCKRWRDKNSEKFRAYMRKYKKDHYDPVKKRKENMKYRCGIIL